MQPPVLFINGVELGTIDPVKRRRRRDPIDIVLHNNTPATMKHLRNLLDSDEALDVTFGTSTLKAHLCQIKNEENGSVLLGFLTTDDWP